ncbi:MAG: dienelactone hydrolase family protein [Microcoleus sp. SIO2G3]|nr:dienelactone hydrolase family protein [Microcoleus sp. SIO2G3]
MPAFLYTPAESEHQPAILLLMEAFGLTAHIQEIAVRIAAEGYVVLTPDLYYRELPNNKFGYDEVEKAMAMMYRLDFGTAMESDLRAVLAFLKSRSTVYPDRIGVTGFCLGGGLSFFTACKLSSEIAAAAPFYGMVLDEWIDAMVDIAVPIYLFFGGADPFISIDRVQQIEARLKQLGKEYMLKVYSNADHGFFCHERSSYDRLAAEDAWRRLTQFFRQHLQSNAV